MPLRANALLVLTLAVVVAYGRFGLPLLLPREGEAEIEEATEDVCLLAGS